MAEKADPKSTLSFEDLLIANSFEIDALVELLHEKGIISKDEVLAKIQELRRKTPKGQSMAELFPEPYLNVDKSQILIAHILEVLNRTGLNAHQAKDVLARCRIRIEQGQALARKRPH